jgi:hypothetical protein
MQFAVLCMANTGLATFLKIPHMKKFFMALFNKAALLMEDDLATRDRSFVSRVMTILLLTITVFCTLFYCIKSIG